jgi:hypothetical protein
MITDEDFKFYIDQIDYRYERIKDMVQASDYFLTPMMQQAMLAELGKLRDVACTGLRESHITKNFKEN